MRRRVRRLRDLTGERVVIQTRDGRSLQGVLIDTGRDCLFLAHFRYLDEAQAADLPGEAMVLLDNLSWIHRLAPGER